jgi:spore coat protein U-like protein
MQECRTMSIQIARWIAACLFALAVSGAYASCSVSTAGVNFGTYNVFSTSPQDITGTINVSCTNSASYSIALSPGNGTYLARTLKSQDHKLNYNLYIDSTHLTVWGDGSSGTKTVSGKGQTGHYTVYGRIAARQNSSVGNYADTITVTVTF